MKTIAVIGSRSFTDYNLFCAKLEYLISGLGEDIQFCSGGAAGADSLIARYCSEKGLNIIEHLPDYTKYSGKVAPLKRNRLIVDDADYLIAFTTGSSGTAYTIKLAEKKGIPIRIVNV